MFIYGVSDHPRGLSTQLRLKQRVRGDKNEMMKSQHRHPFPDFPLRIRKGRRRDRRECCFLLLLLFLLHLLAPTPTAATESATGALIKLPERS